MPIQDRIKNPILESLGHALAGGTAGAATKFLLYPLDTVKTLNAIRRGEHVSLFDMIESGRLLELYRGLGAGLINVSVFHGIFYYFYTLLKNDYLRNHTDKQYVPIGQALLRNSLAGLATSAITSPLDVIQVQLQSSDKAETIASVSTSVLREDGITGFWRGFKISILLVINPALVFLIYERVRKISNKTFGRKSPFIDFMAGAVAKAFATILTYPLIFAKTNLQAKRSGRSLSRTTGNGIPRDVASASVTSLWGDVVAKRGFWGLYDGLSTKLTQTVLQNAVIFMCKEFFVKYTFAFLIMLIRFHRRHQNRVELVKA